MEISGNSLSTILDPLQGLLHVSYEAGIIMLVLLKGYVRFP